MRLGVLRGVSTLFRLGGWLGIAGAAAAIFGLGWAGCAGDAFTVQGAPGSSGSAATSSSIGPSSAGSSSTGSGASGSSSIGGPVDGSASFCSGYPGYLLCEAFDDGAPGQLAELPQDAGPFGTFLTDPDASVPPSRQSMQVMTPQLTMPGTSVRTLAGKSFMMTGTDLLLEAEFNLGKNCISDGVAVAIITASSPSAPGSQYSVVLTLELSAWSVVEILTSPDAGTTLYPHSTGVGILPDQWTDVKLTLHLLKKSVDLSLGSATVSGGITLAEEPLLEPTGTGITASFAVGAAVTDVDAEALVCDLEVDNVLFNDATTP
jgi:hypothetical protein